MDKIRNFCIIAHIDHGKSTLADRLLELTHTVAPRQMKRQLLDNMELEREKGITIKLAPVRMSFNGYYLNLIDTPGHVDFGYEVSRSLAACESALLVVDATQGIQAQTLVNLHLAQSANLQILPIVNKIDLLAADVPKTVEQIQNLLPDATDVLAVSAKTGQGVEQVLSAIVTQLSPPGPPTAELQNVQALIFDSHYDDYRGVVLYVRLRAGRLPKGANLLLMATQTEALALEIGYLNPQMQPADTLTAGEIGYIVTNLKSASDARVGDTVTTTLAPASVALTGYQPAVTRIFAGLFPLDSSAYDNFKKAVAKLALSDSTLVFENENSPILGHGFRCGFLGLLHLDIVLERLKREYDLEVIVANPSTAYEVVLTNGTVKLVKTPLELPDASQIEQIREPWVTGEIVCQSTHLGAVMQLLTEVRGQPGEVSYVDQLARLTFAAPLANLLTDFYDRLKSLTSGHGSLSYDFDAYRADKLVRLDFYVAHEMVGALSLICHQSEARRLGETLVKRLKEIIPRQQFKIALQAAIGGKFLVRDDIPSFRKDVTAKLYGGDVTRRKKLLEKQKKGKAKLKKIGKVDLPPGAFTVLLQSPHTK